MIRITVLAGLLVAAMGCGGSSTKADGKMSEVELKVLTQASFELQCDKANITISKLSDDGGMMGVKNQTFGARGCDKQASYKTSCGMGMCNVFNMAQTQSTSRPM